METTIRGIIEREIDALTSANVLESALARIQSTSPMKSIGDCLFGYIVGFALGRYMSLMSIKIKTIGIVDAEKQEFWDIIERRAMEIKGKINIAMGK